MKQQILQMIQKRIDELKIEMQTYLQEYKRESKFYNIDNANKCFRWYKEVRGRIEELEELAIKINKGVN